MVSRLFKGAAVTVATLSFASAASAGCGSSLFCGQSGATSAIPAPLLTYESSASGSWSDSAANFGSASSWGSSSTYAPSSFSTTMSSTQADATYGTGSISDTYSGVIYVRYPVPVAVPYTSPCHTIKNYSRYGDWRLIK